MHQQSLRLPHRQTKHRGTKAHWFELLEPRQLMSVYYVNANDPIANDTNAGTSLTAPLKTISKALSLARNNNTTSQTDTILVRGGVYREQLNVWTSNSGASVADRSVISAYINPNTGSYEDVYVLASDLTTGTWIQDGASQRWYLPNFTVQTSEVFVDWSPSNDAAPLLQIGGYNGETSSNRKINGTGIADMTPGSFYGDVATSRLYVWLPDSSDPNLHQISYASRPHVVYQPGTALPTGGYSYASYFDFKGLKLRHTNAYMPSGQDNYSAIYTANDQRLFDMDVQWNAGTGVILRDTGQMINCVSSNNGGVGVAGQGRGFLIDGGQYNDNFWRRYNNGSAAGIKVITNTPDLYGDIRNAEVARNFGQGIWYDTDYYNTVTSLISGNYIHDNTASGIFLEASKNFLVTNNIITGNQGSGIALNAVENARILNNTIVGNFGNAGIELNGGTRANSTSWGGGTTGLRNNVIRNNIIADNFATFDLNIAQVDNNALVTNNVSDNNLFYRRGGPLQMSRGGTYLGTWGPAFDTLAAWQAASGEDAASVNADPRFTGGSGVTAYRIGADSNAIGIGAALSEISFDRDGNPRPTGSGIDAGAYEFTTGGNGLASPAYINSDASVWIDDVLPTNALATNPDATGNTGVNRFWYWSNQTAAAGLAAVDSMNITTPHRQYFQNATERPVQSGDSLFAWVWLDPQNPPSELMLEFKDSTGSWEHRANWGANIIAAGVDGTASRKYQGQLPTAGGWTRLTIPASDLDLSGRSLTGFSFYLSNGRALLDRVGNASAPTLVNAPPTSITVIGTSVDLNALAASSAGETNLQYSWSLQNGEASSVTFSRNNSLEAKTTTVQFTQAGTYDFQLTVLHEASGLSTTATVSVSVTPTATNLLLTPSATVSLRPSQQQQFTVTCLDQFAQPMTPSSISWSATGGTIDSTGLFTAGNSTGVFSVTASVGSASSSTPVSINASVFDANGDIGIVGLPGSLAPVVNGVYTLKGSGTDISGTSDSFQYAWLSVTGDTQIIARVTGLTGGVTGAKAGVMFRETLTAGSRNASTLLTVGSGASFQYRSTTSGTTTRTSVTGIAAPYWVKLVRIGSSFISYLSSDGVTWTKVGKNTNVSMGTTAYVGLAVTSKSNASLATATFDNVSVSAAPVLSTGRTATASSTAVGSSASYINDNNAATFWTSAAAGTQWITLDLGSQRSIARIYWDWGSNYARSFKIQASTDNATWSNIYTTTTGTGGNIDLFNLNTNARYVRIYMSSGSFSNYQLRELRVFGA